MILFCLNASRIYLRGIRQNLNFKKISIGIRIF